MGLAHSVLTFRSAGRGGASIYGKQFEDELHPDLKFTGEWGRGGGLDSECLLTPWPGARELPAVAPRGPWHLSPGGAVPSAALGVLDSNHSSNVTEQRLPRVSSRRGTLGVLGVGGIGSVGPWLAGPSGTSWGAGGVGELCGAGSEWLLRTRGSSTLSLPPSLPGAGILAMANAGPDTNGSQFFVTLAPTQWLDGKHTIFGRVCQGIGMVNRVGMVETNSQDRPVDDVKILKAYPSG